MKTHLGFPALALGLLCLCAPPAVFSQAPDAGLAPDRVDSLAYWMTQAEAIYERDPQTGVANAESALRLLAERPDTSAAIRVLYWMGQANWALGAFPDAIANADSMMALAEASGNLRARAQSKVLKAGVLGQQARFFGLEQNYDQALALSRQGESDYASIGDSIGIAEALRTSASILGSLGRPDEAKKLVDRALSISRATGNARSIASSLIASASVRAARSNFGRDIAAAEEALSVAESAGDLPTEVKALTRLWTAYFDHGDYTTALDYARRELAIKLEFGDKQGIAWDWHDIANIEEASGDLESAIRSARASLAVWEEIDNEWEVARNLDYLGGLLATRAATLDSLGQFEEANTVYRDYVATSDRLVTSQSLAKVAEMKEQYRTWERQAEILSLEQSRKIQRLWLWALVAGLGLLATIAFLVYGRFRFANKARTELALAYDHLQESHEELKRTRAEVDDMKARFFANISHEFRTPLTLILGQIDAVSEHLDGKDLERLEMAARNGDQLKRLINQLLELSKLEAGRSTLEAEPADLVQFVRSLYFSFESLAEAKQISQDFSTTHDRIVTRFDPEKLEQVFNNLLSNAFKFTGGGGTVGIELTYDPKMQDDAVMIRVRDTGIGIPSDQLDHVFNRFYQVGATSTREYEGTGIGLALAKELIGLHGGTISVSSQEGEGSVFAITLPVDPIQVHLPAPPPARPARAAVAQINGFKHAETSESEAHAGETGAEVDITVLVVEDNADVRSYLRDNLKDAYRVIEAANGELGIELAREEIPDLIITDVMMPKMDGYELASMLRSDTRTSHIPIIMLTARAAQEDKLAGLQTGVDDYLVKPFSPKELQVRARNLIELRRSLRDRFRSATIIKPAEIEATNMDKEFLKSVIQQIEAHFDDPAFGVDAIAGSVNMSVSQLNRKLNALVGQSAGKLQRSMRLQRAADLLAQEAGNVTEIAYEVGFSSPAHFATAFKKQFGCSPSEYEATG